MTEAEFNKAVDEMIAERLCDNLQALDLGKRFRELCREYLQSNEHLPETFSVFEDSTPYVGRGKGLEKR